MDGWAGAAKPRVTGEILEKIKGEEERGGAGLSIALWFSCQAFHLCSLFHITIFTLA